MTIRSSTKRVFSRGFTIVELLIVIVVIGILAAIVIVAYTGVQSRAQTTAVQSDLRNTSQKVALAYVDSSAYPTGDTDLMNLKLKFSTKSYNALVFCTRTDGSAWALIAQTVNGNNFYVNNQNSTPQVYTDTFPQSGATACPSAGVTSPGWRWFVQSSTGPWWTGVN